MRELINQIWQVIRPWAWSAWHVFADRWRYVIVFSAVFALALGTVFAYRQWYEKEIVVLGGSPGSSGERLAVRIKRELERTPRVPGINYRVTIENSPGFDAMEDRVRNDRNGQLIGFTLDSVKEREGIRLLLPLGYDYLHVLGRTEFLQSLKTPDGETPRRLSTVIPHLKPNHSIFAGSRGSGVRRMAEIVLKHFGRNVDQMSHLAVDDWEEAKAALASGEIDVAFYVGPFGAETVHEMAGDGSVVLLGLGDIYQALVQEQPYDLIEGEFEEHSYTAKPGNLPFCPETFKTVTARRMVVCSEFMSVQDAYLISKGIKAALSSDESLVGVWGEQPKRNGFGIATHPGAALLRDGTSPSTWWRPWTWPPYLASLFVALLAVFLQEVVSLSRTAPPPPPSPSATPTATPIVPPAGAAPGPQTVSQVSAEQGAAAQPAPSEAYVAVAERVERIEDQFIPENASAAEIRKQKAEVRQIFQEVRGLHQSRRITDDEYRTLRAALSKTLGRLEIGKLDAAAV